MEIKYFIEQLNDDTHSATFQFWVVGEEEFKHRTNIDIPIPVPEGAEFDSFVLDACRSLIYQSERRKVIAASAGLGPLVSRIGVTCCLNSSGSEPLIMPIITLPDTPVIPVETLP